MSVYSNQWGANLYEDVSKCIEKKKNSEDYSNFCIHLYADLIQILHKYLNQQGDTIFSVFKTDEMFKRYSHAYVNADELLWMTAVIQEYIVERNISEKKETDPVYAVECYVKQHMSHEIKRTDLAKHVHLNIDYLARVFKQKRGVTLNDYIIAEKMETARNLLETTQLPISVVAAKVGYSNFSYFSKVYKKSFGHAPAEER